MRNDPERVAELLGLPKQSSSCSACASAMPPTQAAGEVKPRLPQSDRAAPRRATTATPRAAERKAYDAEMATFSARHEMQAATWTQRVLNRLGPIKSMNGRERMRDRAGGTRLRGRAKPRAPARNSRPSLPFLSRDFRSGKETHHEPRHSARASAAARWPSPAWHGASLASALDRARRPRPPATKPEAGKPPAAAAATSSKPETVEQRIRR